MTFLACWTSTQTHRPQAWRCCFTQLVEALLLFLFVLLFSCELFSVYVGYMKSPVGFGSGVGDVESVLVVFVFIWKLKIHLSFDALNVRFFYHIIRFLCIYKIKWILCQNVSCICHLCSHGTLMKQMKERMLKDSFGLSVSWVLISQMFFKSHTHTWTVSTVRHLEFEVCWTNSSDVVSHQVYTSVKVIFSRRLCLTYPLTVQFHVNRRSLVSGLWVQRLTDDLHWIQAARVVSCVRLWWGF